MSEETGRDAVELAALLAHAPVGPPRSLRYGAHPSQVVDVYGDFGPRAPRVAVLHGGFWRERYDRTHLSPLAADLAARGVGVALVEYRRVGGGGGWPAPFEDVVAGLAALAGHAGGPPPALLGHSAGGQLALCVAARHPGHVARTVAVAPVADLTRGAALGVGDGAVDALLGAEADALLDEADPARLPAPAGPVALLHGTEDGQVPPELSARYAARHGAALRRLPGVGHYGPVTPGAPGHAELCAALGAPSERRR